MKYLSNFFENKYILAASLIALVGSPIADAYNGNSYILLGVLLSILFLTAILSELHKYRIYQKEIIHIPLVIKIDEGPNAQFVLQNLFQHIEKKYNYTNYEKELKKYFGITADELLFEYSGSIFEFDRIMSFARIIRYKISSLEKQLNGRVVFHLAYYKRPSIGFLIGTLFRTEGVVVYQNNDFENRFFPVAYINSRKYKERVADFEKYTIVEDFGDLATAEVLIIIESASHNVKINSKSLSSYKNMIMIRLVEDGTIPYENDWVLYANEIYNVINSAQTQFKRITIAHAMPESIAVIVGMAIENYWNINILQYENNDYPFVLNMQEIKYYF